MGKTLCVAEYSVSQNAFNIDMLDKILALNCYMSLKGFSNDYKIICIGSYEKCKKKVDQMRKELEKNEV